MKKSSVALKSNCKRTLLNWLPFVYRGKTELGKRIACALLGVALSVGAATVWADEPPVPGPNDVTTHNPVYVQIEGEALAIKRVEMDEPIAYVNMAGGTLTSNLEEGSKGLLYNKDDTDFNFKWNTVETDELKTSATFHFNSTGKTAGTLEISVAHTLGDLTVTGNKGELVLSSEQLQSFGSLNVNGKLQANGAAGVNNKIVGNVTIGDLSGVQFNVGADLTNEQLKKNEQAQQLYLNGDYDPNYSLTPADEGYEEIKTKEFLTEAEITGYGKSVASYSPAMEPIAMTVSVGTSSTFNTAGNMNFNAPATTLVGGTDYTINETSSEYSNAGLIDAKGVITFAGEVTASQVLTIRSNVDDNLNNNKVDFQKGLTVAEGTEDAKNVLSIDAMNANISNGLTLNANSELNLYSNAKYQESDAEGNFLYLDAEKNKTTDTADADGNPYEAAYQTSTATITGDVKVMANAALTVNGNSVFDSMGKVDENGNQLYHDADGNETTVAMDTEGNEYKKLFNNIDLSGTATFNGNATFKNTENVYLHGSTAFKGNVTFDNVSYASNYNYKDHTIGGLVYGENTTINSVNGSYVDINARTTTVVVSEVDNLEKVVPDIAKFAVNLNVDETSTIELWTGYYQENQVAASKPGDGNAPDQGEFTNKTRKPGEFQGNGVVFSFRDVSKESMNDNINFVFNHVLSGDGVIFKSGSGLLKMEHNEDKKNFANNNTTLKVYEGKVIIGADVEYNGDSIIVYEQYYDSEAGLADIGTQGVLGFEKGSSISVKNLDVRDNSITTVVWNNIYRDFQTGGELWFDFSALKDTHSTTNVAEINAVNMAMDTSAFVYYEGLSTLASAGNASGADKGTITFSVGALETNAEGSSKEEQLKALFDKPLTTTAASTDATGKTITLTIEARNALDFALTNGLNQDQIDLAKSWDNTRTSEAQSPFLDAVWNESNPEIVITHMKNLSSGSGLDNVVNMTGNNLGSAGSQFFGGTFVNASSGITTRGQSKQSSSQSNANSLKGGCGLGSLLDGWTVWGGPSYTSMKATSDGDKDGFNVHRAGFLGGLRRQFDDKTSGGFLFAYSSPEMNQAGNFSGEGWENISYRSDVEMSDYQLAMHLEHVFCEKWEASFFVGMGSQFMDWNRQVFDSKEGLKGMYDYDGSTKGNTFTFTAYLARPIEINDHFVLRPTIGLDSEHSWLYGFQENYSGENNTISQATDGLKQCFAYDKVSYSRNMARIGLVAGVTSDNNRLGMSGRIFYGVALGGDDAAFVTQTGLKTHTTQTLQGLAIGDESLNLGYGLFYYLNEAKTLSASADYNAILYKNATTQNVTAGIQYKF